jgi:hypothetical protein
MGERPRKTTRLTIGLKGLDYRTLPETALTREISMSHMADDPAVDRICSSTTARRAATGCERG